MTIHKLKRAHIGDKLLFFVRVDRPLNDPNERLFTELIAFANKQTNRDGKPVNIGKGAFGLFDKEREKPEFFDDVVDAHSLVRSALDEIVRLGAVRRKTERQINEYLSGVWATQFHSLEDGEIQYWIHYHASTCASTCAYVLALLTGTELSENVRRCKLSECQKFFWRPLRRGPRPSYCSENHRLRGASRESRGKTA